MVSYGVTGYTVAIESYPSYKDALLEHFISSLLRITKRFEEGSGYFSVAGACSTAGNLCSKSSLIFSGSDQEKAAGLYEKAGNHYLESKNDNSMIVYFIYPENIASKYYLKTADLLELINNPEKAMRLRKKADKLKEN